MPGKVKVCAEAPGSSRNLDASRVESLVRLCSVRSLAIRFAAAFSLKTRLIACGAGAGAANVRGLRNSYLTRTGGLVSIVTNSGSDIKLCSEEALYETVTPKRCLPSASGGA